jgi:hypothetical protein
MNDNSKKLKRMAVWITAIFATIFAIFMAVFFLMNYPLSKGSVWNGLGAAFGSGWPIFLITAVLCLGTYFGYKMYLDRKK